MKKSNIGNRKELKSNGDRDNRVLYRFNRKRGDRRWY